MRRSALLLSICAAVLLASCPSGNSGSSGSNGPSGSAPLGSEANPIRMALVPSTEAEKLVETVKPISDMLAEKTGYAVESEVLVSYVAAVEGLGSERFQIGWLPPFAYVLANREYGTEVALLAKRHGKATYRGQVLVKADSDYREIADLKGAKFAFVDPSSASGHLYPKTMLMDAGLDPDADLGEVVFAGSHQSAVTSLLNGSVDAAACYVDAREQLEKYHSDVFDTTRVLAKTDPIPADSIAYSTQLTDEQQRKLTQAFLEIAESERGSELLYELYEIEGLVEGDDSDFEPVRETADRLGINLREKIGE